MPKTTQQAARRGGDDDTTAAELTATLCGKADALYRAAVECCRQHERVAKLAAREAPEEEQRAAYAQVDHCDDALIEMTAAYEKCGARLHPNGDDEAWWHRANALWHASREYARRHEDTMGVRRRTCSEQQPEAFGQLNVEFELEASALLALRQATEAYKKVRPHAEC